MIIITWKMLLLIILIQQIACFSVTGYFGLFDEAYVDTMNTGGVPWSMFDRLILSFVDLTPNGFLNVTKLKIDRINNVTKWYKKSKPDGQVFLSLYDEREERFVIDAKHAVTFKNNVKKWVTSLNLNGIDVDWETASINVNSDVLVTVLKACWPAKVTHAVWPYVTSATTVGLLSHIVDNINIMSYDMRIDQIESLVLDYHQHGFPFDKMVLGIETESGNDNLQSMDGKIKLIQKYNLSGLFVWRVDNDAIQNHQPQWTTINLLKSLLHKYQL